MLYKYKHLNELYKAITPFVLRLKKEYHKARKIDAIPYINELQLSDEIINEIIQLIKDEGKMTLKEIISDINISIKENNWWREEQVKCVRNKSQLINYIKTHFKNYVILTKPVDCLFNWDVSKKGFVFYAELERNISDILKVFNLRK